MPSNEEPIPTCKAETLSPHPEGGAYREVFRSNTIISTQRGDERSALTHIYFSLSKGECSSFHRVQSDEVWNLYRGDGVRIYIWNDNTHVLQIEELSENANQYCQIIPAGLWQAAEPIHDDVLVGCSVGPGFEFEDFALLTQHCAQTTALLEQNPELSRFIAQV